MFRNYATLNIYYSDMSYRLIIEEILFKAPELFGK